MRNFKYLPLSGLIVSLFLMYGFVGSNSESSSSSSFSSPSSSGSGNSSAFENGLSRKARSIMNERTGIQPFYTSDINDNEKAIKDALKEVREHYEEVFYQAPAGVERLCVDVPKDYDESCAAIESSGTVKVCYTVGNSGNGVTGQSNLWVNVGGPGANPYNKIASKEPLLEKYYDAGFQVIGVDPRGTGPGTFLSESAYVLDMIASNSPKFRNIFKRHNLDHLVYNYFNRAALHRWVFNDFVKEVSYLSSHHNACDTLYINEHSYGKKEINYVGVSYGGILLTIINNVLEKTHSKFGRLATAIFDSASYKAKEGLLGHIDDINIYQNRADTLENKSLYKSVYQDINLDRFALWDALDEYGYPPSMLKEDLYNTLIVEIRRGGQEKQNAYNFIENLKQLSASDIQQVTPVPSQITNFSNNVTYGEEVGFFSFSLYSIVQILDFVENNPQNMKQILSNPSVYNRYTVKAAEYFQYMMPYLKKDRIFHYAESVNPIADTKYLIVHSDKDALVPFSMGEELYTDIFRKGEYSEVYFIESKSSTYHGYVSFSSDYINYEVIDFLNKQFESGAFGRVVYGADSGFVFSKHRYP